MSQSTSQPNQTFEEPKPIIEVNSPIHSISCSEEFEQLTHNEQMYSYYFYKAAWEGAKICYFQKSFEAPALFILIQLTFQQDLKLLKQEVLNNGISEDDYKNILVYCAAVLNNCGNYKSFGDTKFVPNVTESTFEKFLTLSINYKNPYYQSVIKELWNDIKGEIFRYDGIYKKIGYPVTDGQTGYYSSQMTKEEIDIVDELLSILNISPLNTRIVKLQENVYQVLIASGNIQKGTEHTYKSKTIKITYGDYHSIIARVATNLQKAIPFAANDNQRNMLKAYVSHFLNGDIELHKESQREWVKDKGPVIETNIGFIETYLDPKQVRAEFEGFVSVVHKKNSERLNDLVQNAEKLLENMPWPKEFELEKFLKPDFTSLSILAFGSSGTPLGINIPNYDDIRQNFGFKNVYLSNVMMKLKNILFMSKSDAALLEKWSSNVWFQKVSYHELLGHGCGKLFTETLEEGKKFNENIINPLTKQKIASWYKPGETWNGKFGSLSNNYEECRADSVALYFSTFIEGTKILLPELVPSFEELMYVSWIEVAYSGIKALEFYIAEKQVWGQAHMNGRFVILQVLLEAGNNLVKIEKVKDSEGKDDLLLTVDKSQIQTTGKKAMAQFLLKMQVYKSTADLESAKEMFGAYSKVNDFFLDVRRIVLERRQPRRLEVQGHLELINDKPVYSTFEESFEGILQSYVTRYSYFDLEMLNQYEEYKNLYKKQEVATFKL